MDEGCPSWRAVIPHVDDLGACHGANQAFFGLAAAGRVTCGSVMVPGAWFREVVDAAGRDGSLDLGVHLTLTSEWETCRWGPVSTVSPASGLIDGDGYFWRDLASVRRHLVVEAAEAEMRTQIERAVAAGMAPTHLDAHMGVAMIPELLPAMIRLGREFGLVPVLPRTVGWVVGVESYRGVVEGLRAAGAPVIDHCRGTLAVEGAALEAGWAEMVHGFGTGITHLALHCTLPGDFRAMAPGHAGWREQESALFASGAVGSMLESAGVAVIGLRGLQEAWRAWAPGMD